MGLLDSVIGGLMSNSGGGSPIQGVLMNMLGGGQQAASGGQAFGAGGLAGGGLTGLISSFEQAGLGHIAQSWVGNGPNQPVSQQQLQTVFGDQQTQAMAAQAGMPQQDFLSELSRHLPSAVDRMTPGGTPPDQETVSV